MVHVYLTFNCDIVRCIHALATGIFEKFWSRSAVKFGMDFDWIGVVLV